MKIKIGTPNPPDVQPPTCDRFLFIFNFVLFDFSWCRLIRTAKISNVALLILNGVSEKCYKKNKDCFPYIQEHFDVVSRYHEVRLAFAKSCLLIGQKKLTSFF